MEVVVKETYDEISALGAKIIAEVITRKPRCVIGLATGTTPLGIYKELARMNNADDIDFAQVVTFNLDEYVGIPTDHSESYRLFMNENLFDQVNIRKENTYVPDGMADDIHGFCEWYEQKILEHGGIDIQDTLPNGTVEDVVEEVKKRIAIWAPGGGYVFCAAHNIQIDVPPENVTAMYRAADEWGTYPLSAELLELRSLVPAGIAQG